HPHDRSPWGGSVPRQLATRHRPAEIEPKPSFQVLERTFGILEVFSEARPEWSTTEIARARGLPVPTVHRILAALKRLGYVSQHEETKRFRLGLGALELGERARAVAGLRPVAIGPLRQLSAATGETALLTVLTPERDRGVCLERVETSQPLRLSVQPGRQLPLHAGASQKALLAYMPDQDIDRVISQPLERFCRSTITSAAAMRRERGSIRERGWRGSHEGENGGGGGRGDRGGGGGGGPRGGALGGGAPHGHGGAGRPPVHAAHPRRHPARPRVSRAYRPVTGARVPAGLGIRCTCRPQRGEEPGMTKDRPLEGKVAIVTGGAKGNGPGHWGYPAEDGAPVALARRDGEGLRPQGTAP